MRSHRALGSTTNVPFVSETVKLGKHGRLPGEQPSKVNQNLDESPSFEEVRHLAKLLPGSGSYDLEMDGYDQAPHDVQQKLVDAYAASRA